MGIQQAPASTSTPTTAKVAAATIATTSESAAAFVETPSIVIQTVTKRVHMICCHRKKCKNLNPEAPASHRWKTLPSGKKTQKQA
jgi:hypothetical protein